MDVPTDILRVYGILLKELFAKAEGGVSEMKTKDKGIIIERLLKAKTPLQACKDTKKFLDWLIVYMDDDIELALRIVDLGSTVEKAIATTEGK